MRAVYTRMYIYCVSSWNRLYALNGETILIIRSVITYTQQHEKYLRELKMRYDYRANLQILLVRYYLNYYGAIGAFEMKMKILLLTTPHGHHKLNVPLYNALIRLWSKIMIQATKYSIAI